ncbi:MAG: DUF6338 family protein [Planctomycetaceae bacterium]|nr:DUF6338 family protein [Planctomycetaceae bacterium]
MDIPSSDVIKVVYALLPGFVTAWIFYALTAYARLSPFERTVQALIFTGIIQVLVLAIRESLFFLGRVAYGFGEWTDNGSFTTSMIVAIAFGLVYSAAANNNWIHPLLQRLGITYQPSYPSEWFSALAENQVYVVLHLAGNRRILGWPCEWPNQCDCGHFVLMDASWLSEDNEPTQLENVKSILIPAKDVEMVEFLKMTNDEDGNASQHQL